MTGTEALIAQLLGVGGVLIAATVLGEALERAQPPRHHNPMVDDFNLRVRGWWVMGALLAASFLLGLAGVTLLFAFCSLAALREFLTLTTRNKADHWALVVSFFVVLPIQYAAIWMGWYGFYSVFVPVYIFLFLPMLSVLRNRTDRFLTRVAETQWALMLSVYCMSHIPALLVLDIPGFEGRQVLLILFLVVMAQSAEGFWRLWCHFVGNRLVAPAVSQTRCWEGLFAAVLSTGALGALVYWATPFGPVQSGAMAMAVAITGCMGSMALLAIKRDRGVRDWGHMADGQGGLLDRLDAVIFAAPVFFHLTRFFFQSV